MTQLCAIPGCRIRGRHLPGCGDDDCRGCLPRSTTDGLVCDVCTGSAGGRLAEIIQLTPDLCLVAYGLVQRGSGGGGNGKPGSRSPGNDDALDTLHGVNNRLTTIARDIAAIRALQEPSVGPGVAETLTAAAKWLSRQMVWLKHAVDEQGGPYAAHVFAEIRECRAEVAAKVNGSSDRRYLGPCGAAIVDFDFVADEAKVETCDGDVYAREGAQRGRCRTCGAEVATDERRAWLDGEVRAHAYTAAEIADAYPIKANTIRQWLSRGLLVAHGKLNGRPLLLLGDVLDLAAGDAARREGDRATRARRTAARAAESEEAA